MIDFHEHRVFLRLLLARFLFLVGIYATGRFLLFIVSDRLHLQSRQAAVQAGNTLVLLTLITVVASPLARWLTDRFGRPPLMIAGCLCPRGRVHTKEPGLCWSEIRTTTYCEHRGAAT